MGDLLETTARVPDVIRDSVQRAFEENSFELPLLPQTAIDVLALCQSSNADARSLSDVLHRDQSIAGNVLRIANSPLCGALVQITSLQQAVSRLGIGRLVEVVVAISTKGRKFDIPEAWQVMLGDEMRRRSVLVGLFAKEIARVGRSNVETAFLQGLLHDMGKPVLLMLLRDIQQDCGRMFDMPEVEATLARFHAGVGARLCESWNLAPVVAESIRHQHDWRELEDPPVGAAMIGLARAISEFEEGQTDYEPLVEHPGTIELNLYPDELESVVGLQPKILEIAGAMQ